MNKIRLTLVATLLAGASIAAHADDSGTSTTSDTTSNTSTVTTTTTSSAYGGGAGGAVRQYVDDSVVTSRVSAALLADHSIGTLNVQVETSGGVVSLNGQAASDKDKLRAEEVARSVEGVRDVRSNILLQ